MVELDRIPPHDLVMEINVLGSMLLSAEDAKMVLQRMNADDFYKGAHRRIFTACRHILENTGALDHALLRSRLNREGNLEEIGGSEYIGSILSESVTGNPGSYIDILKDLALKRRIIALSSETMRYAFDGKQGGEIITGLKEQLAEMECGPSNAPAISLPDDRPSGLPAEFAEESAAKPLCLPWENVDHFTKMLRPKSVTVLGGPAGWGKSLWALNLAMSLHTECAWATLPLEGCKDDLERRALAYMSKEWWVLDKGPERAGDRQRLWEQYQDDLKAFCAGVSENPLLEKPTISHLDVVDWTERALATHRGVTIDNLSFISFPDKARWTVEADFIRMLIRIAEAKRGNILLLAHTTKGAGKGKGNELSGENLQGSAMFKRMVDNVLILERHDTKESTVIRGGGQMPIRHDRTLIIDKTRHSHGGVKIAMTLNDARFEDLGVIIPSKRRRPADA